MSPIPHLNANQAAAALAAQRGPHHTGYFAFYSSILQGIVTDPALMLVPADDHLVHRGDGIFETLKCVDGGIYLWREHVQRLLHSAKAIALHLPWTDAQLADITAQTIRAGNHRDCLVRMIVSRGPGSLGVSPYDCPAPALYLLVYESKPSFMDAHPGGARVITSPMPVKSGIFATIKTTNYLPNALLKKEATDAGADFALTFDEHDHLAEGATENFGIVDAHHILRVPGPERILLGTTMNRALQLARALLADGRLRGIQHTPITRAELATAPEILIFGTTPDVTSVVTLDGKPVADGKPGPIGSALLALLRHDIHHNKEVRLQVLP
ncbi:MAG: aminotransferase class IV [Kiritimatiellae bacterium]|nr:aminotransferase class IV [Kiritimatiellia bacterium]MCO5067821.1 aminotransferase class IV [Kiritimatiellia bacterium]